MAFSQNTRDKNGEEFWESVLVMHLKVYPGLQPGEAHLSSDSRETEMGGGEIP